MGWETTLINPRQHEDHANTFVKSSSREFFGAKPNNNRPLPPPKKKNIAKEMARRGRAGLTFSTRDTREKRRERKYAWAD